MYFLYVTEDLIDKFYYISVDSPKDETIKPIEIYKPIKLPISLNKILEMLKSGSKNLDDLLEGYKEVSEDKGSIGLISRYLKDLKELDLIIELKEKKDKKKYFSLTEKGKWFV